MSSAILQSKLVIRLEDQASSNARGLKATIESLKKTLDDVSKRPYKMAVEVGKQLHDQTRATSAAVAFGMRSIVQQAQDFREKEWGFGFARLPDHIEKVMEDGQEVIRLKSADWAKELATTSQEMRDKARSLGLMPVEVMGARTEVEKLGFRGAQSESLLDATLGLRMADSELPADLAAKYLGSMFRNYADERKKIIAAIAKEKGLEIGKDGLFADPKLQAAFERNWLMGVAAKSAIAAADSALGPKDLIEGVRQYAPQWASLGMRPEIVLGALAHGSNSGFGASELGTSFKSWGNRLIQPTQEGVRWMSQLGMDRTKWTGDLEAADATKATNAINSLLGGQVYLDKGGRKFKAEIQDILYRAQKEGTTASPEVQGRLVRMISEKLGAGWAGKEAEIAEAVVNATMVSTGNINIVEFIREAKAKGMNTAAMLKILEGRHVARSTPMFKFFEEFEKMIEKLDKVDGRYLGSIVEARSQSDAAALVRLQGAWQDLIITIAKSPVIIQVIDGLAAAINALSTVNPTVVSTILYGLAGLAGVGAVGVALAGVAAGFRVLRTALAFLGITGFIAARFANAVTGLSLAARMAVTPLRMVGAALLGLTALRGLSRIGTPDALNKGGPKGAGPAASMLPTAAATAATTAAASRPRAVWNWVKRIGGGGMRAIPYAGAAYTLYEVGGFLYPYMPTIIRSTPEERKAAAEGDARVQRHFEERAKRRRDAATRLAEIAPDVKAADTPAAQTPNPAQNVVPAVKGTMAEARAIMRAEDYTSEGLRIANQIADGLRAGASGIADAARQAVSEGVRRAVREAHSDGGLR